MPSIAVGPLPATDQKGVTPRETEEAHLRIPTEGGGAHLELEFARVRVPALHRPVHSSGHDELAIRRPLDGGYRPLVALEGARGLDGLARGLGGRSGHVPGDR